VAPVGIQDRMSSNVSDQVFPCQVPSSSRSRVLTRSGDLPVSTSGGLGVDVETMRTIQGMLQLAQNGTVDLEVWQGMTLVLLLMLKRKCARVGIEACFTEPVLGLLLRLLPRALPEAAPVLSAMRPHMQSAILRPPSCLIQTIDEHVFAALPLSAGGAFHGSRPSPQGMELLRRLSTVVMNCALSVAVGLPAPAQAAFTQDDIAPDSGHSEGAALEGLHQQQQPPQQQHQLQQPPQQPITAAQPQQNLLLEQFQQLLWRRQDESCNGAGSALESQQSSPPHMSDTGNTNVANLVESSSWVSSTSLSVSPAFWPLPVSQEVDDAESVASHMTRSTASHMTRSTGAYPASFAKGGRIPGLANGTHGPILDGRPEAAAAIGPASDAWQDTAQNLERLQGL